jgi:hypothetical protein
MRRSCVWWPYRSCGANAHVTRRRWPTATATFGIGTAADAIAAVRDQHGTVEDYLTRAGGLTGADLTALRRRLTTAPGG